MHVLLQIQELCKRMRFKHVNRRGPTAKRQNVPELKSCFGKDTLIRSVK